MAVACLLTMLVQAPNGVWSAACFYHCVMMGETYYTVGTPQGLEAPPSDYACAPVVRVLGRSPSTASRLQTLLRSGMTAKKPSR